MPSGPGAVTAALARAGYGPPLPPAMLAKLDAANIPAPQSTGASRQTIIVLPNSGSLSTKSKARAERPAAQPATKRWRATAHLAHHNGPPTAARQIYAACDAICALDPPVQGKKAARAAAAGQGVTTQTADIVMRRWETLRQANAQRLCNYGILTFGGRDYLVSQHTDGKSRTNLPTVFLTPIQDLRGCRRWFDRGRTLLWDDGDFL